MSTSSFKTVVCVTALILCAGCSSGTGKSASPKLPSGFVVARNSHLVGAAFGDHLGWSAIIDVERDPVGVYDDYAAQARKLGVPLPTSATHAVIGPSGCKPKTGKLGAGAKQESCVDTGPTCNVAGGGVRCEAQAVAATPSRLWVHLILASGGATHYLVMEVTQGKGSYQSPPVGYLQFSGGQPEVRGRHLETTPGQPFGSENNASRRGYRRFTLESGSRVIADAPGFDLAILKITGDAKEVLARYAEQLAEPDAPPKVTEEQASDGGTYFLFKYSPEGGGFAQFVTDETHKYVKATWASD